MAYKGHTVREGILSEVMYTINRDKEGGYFNVVSHRDSNFLTFSRIIIREEPGSASVEFPGFVPEEYVGRRVRFESTIKIRSSSS